MVSVCSCFYPSHEGFSLSSYINSTNFGVGLTFFFSHFHGSKLSSIFTCKIQGPGDLKALPALELGPQAPPGLLLIAEKAVATSPTTLFSEGKDSPHLVAKQGLGRAPQCHGCCLPWGGCWRQPPLPWAPTTWPH